jgi:hypothetical protein
MGNKTSRNKQQNIANADVIPPTYTYDSDGKLHSFDDNPAVVSPGKMEWYEHGLLHRSLTKPARKLCVNRDTIHEYYFRGEKIFTDNFSMTDWADKNLSIAHRIIEKLSQGPLNLGTNERFNHVAERFLIQGNSLFEWTWLWELDMNLVLKKEEWEQFVDYAKTNAYLEQLIKIYVTNRKLVHASGGDSQRLKSFIDNFPLTDEHSFPEINRFVNLVSPLVQNDSRLSASFDVMEMFYFTLAERREMFEKSPLFHIEQFTRRPYFYASIQLSSPFVSLSKDEFIRMYCRPSFQTLANEQRDIFRARARRLGVEWCIVRETGIHLALRGRSNLDDVIASINDNDNDSTDYDVDDVEDDDEIRFVEREPFQFRQRLLSVAQDALALTAIIAERHESSRRVENPARVRVEAPNLPPRKSCDGFIEKFPDYLLCPICREPFHNPVIVAEYGSTYCKECIESWLKSHSSDPKTNLTIHNRNLLTPCRELGEVVNAIFDAHASTQTSTN